MKKIITAISVLALSISMSSAFATIKINTTTEGSFNNEDYVSKIVAAVYDAKTNDPYIMLVTDGDAKLNKSNVKYATFKISDKDLPFGLTLINAVGKKIAVSFANANYDIYSVSIITDEYWTGESKKKIII